MVFGACFMVCPWLPIADISLLFREAFCINLLAAFPKAFPSSTSNSSISTLEISAELTASKILFFKFFLIDDELLSRSSKLPVSILTNAESMESTLVPDIKPMKRFSIKVVIY